MWMWRGVISVGCSVERVESGVGQRKGVRCCGVRMTGRPPRRGVGVSVVASVIAPAGCFGYLECLNSQQERLGEQLKRRKQTHLLVFGLRP